MKPPLSFLFEDKTHSSFSSTVKDKATSESIRYNILLLSSCNPLSEHVMSGCKKNVILFVLRFTRRCISVAPSRETAGELLLGKTPATVYTELHNLLSLRHRGVLLLHHTQAFAIYSVKEAFVCLAFKSHSHPVLSHRKVWDVLCGGQRC